MSLIPRFWEIPENTAINRLPARYFSYPYADAASASQRNSQESPWVINLDGEWDFHYFTSVDAVTPDVLTGAMAADGKIKVPGNWTRQGYDKPHYTNQPMPFDNQPPTVPDQNPTGVYRRTVTLPPDWQGRRTRLRINGAESMALVYVDGRFVGMSSDSRLPAEFDLTPFLKAETSHLLAIVVIRYTAFSYVEDQDHWWMAGLHRSVELLSTDSAWIEDVFAKTSFDHHTGKGGLNLELMAGFAAAPGRKCQFHLTLLDPDGSLVWPEPLLFDIDGTEYRKDGFSANWSGEIDAVLPWSAEQPHLYTLQIALLDAESSAAIEHSAIRIGFRSVIVADAIMLFNGQPIKLIGVNRHDHDPITGKYVSLETMLQDILLLKQYHFNAVRTAHYPNDPAWLNLCDEYGIYVIDEANQEAHAFYATIGHDPRWQQTFVERAERMVKRDRNHACIFAWSLGNETGHGRNHDAAARACRALDDSRLLHNEPTLRVGWNQNGNSYTPGGELSNDFINPMYPQLTDLIEFLDNPTDTRPLIPCEYSHSMGNSNGGLADYWEAVYRYPQFQGGFIWDWVEQGLLEFTESGKPFYAYGGDYDDLPNDQNFNCNGLVMPDRSPKLAMSECFKVFQPFAFTQLTADQFEITSRRYFAEIDAVELVAEFALDGTIIESVNLGRLQLAPQARTVIRITPPENTLKRARLLRSKELHMRLQLRYHNSLPWAKQGDLCAWEQFAIALPALPSPANAVTTSSQPIANANDWLRDRLPCVLSGPQLHVIRALTDNDGVKANPVHWQRSEKLLCKCKRDGLLDATPPESIRMQSQFAVEPNGWLRCEFLFSIDESIEELPRLGVCFTLPTSYNRVQWFGKGPGESYPDRKAGTWIGQFQSSTYDGFFPYIVPQESGNREDLRWIAVSNNAGDGLMVCSAKPFSGSVLPWSSFEIFAAAHPTDLPESSATHLNIDLRQRGIGTASCGPDTDERFKIRPGSYPFSFWLAPLTSSSAPADLYTSSSCNTSCEISSK